MSCGSIWIIEPPLCEGKDAQAFRTRLFLPFQDGNFRRLLLFITVWNVGVYLSGPFFAVYMLQHLHLDYSMIVSYAVLSSVMDLFSVRFRGRVSDRTTNKTVIFLCSLFVVLIPFGWLFASRDTTVLIAMLHIQGGLFCQVSICAQRIWYSKSPRKANARCITRHLIPLPG